jgi:hypothetical protein
MERDTPKPQTFQPRVKLCTLSMRTAKASGNRYLLGWSGGLKFIALVDPHSPPDAPQFDLYIEQALTRGSDVPAESPRREHRQRQAPVMHQGLALEPKRQGGEIHKHERQRRSPSRKHAELGPNELNDDVPW